MGNYFRSASFSFTGRDTYADDSHSLIQQGWRCLKAGYIGAALRWVAVASSLVSAAIGDAGFRDAAATRGRLNAQVAVVVGRVLRDDCPRRERANIDAIVAVVTRLVFFQHRPVTIDEDTVRVVVVRDVNFEDVAVAILVDHGSRCCYQTVSSFRPGCRRRKRC